MADHETETTKDVLMDALTKVSEFEGPSARDVLKLLIRFEAARAGLPAPNFDVYPPSDVINQVLFPDRD